MSFCGAIEMVRILFPDLDKMWWFKAIELGWHYHLQHKHYQKRNRKIRPEAANLPGKSSTLSSSTARYFDDLYVAVSD